jgi:hypothetical protein
MQANPGHSHQRLLHMIYRNWPTEIIQAKEYAQWATEQYGIHEHTKTHYSMSEPNAMLDLHRNLTWKE